MTEQFAPQPADINDDAGAVLGTFILERLKDISAPDDSGTVSAALAAPGDTTLSDDAGRTLHAILNEIDNSPDHIAALRDLGAAFTQARSCDHTPPDGIVQTQWNRLLRDQGERLRAASMTLSAGQIEIAHAQLAPVGTFLETYFAALPR